MIIIVLLFLGVVIGSGLCSIAETALLSLPLVRARILHEENHKHAKDLLFVKENIADAVASIVIVNNAINIFGSIYIGHLTTEVLGNQWLGLASTVVTFTIIIASEIIPKTIGERYKVSLSLSAARPMRVLIWFFRPAVRIILKSAKPFIAESKRPNVTEAEIKMMLKLGRAEGTVETDEEVLCNRIFKLNDVRAMHIMKPIDEIYALPANRILEEVKDKIIDSRYSRIAVFENDRKDIIGVVQHRVLLREIAKDNYKAYVREFMTPPIYVNWFTKADALLENFQANNQHLFIVQDAEGKDVGLVTMEDVLEEIFGEIYDERDVARNKDL
ncbi:MAG: CBS domain containing-hemolysin-like protein, partial [Candidatus Omnitrophota bacterium]